MASVYLLPHTHVQNAIALGYGQGLKSVSIFVLNNILYGGSYLGTPNYYRIHEIYCAPGGIQWLRGNQSTTKNHNKKPIEAE